MAGTATAPKAPAFASGVVEIAVKRGDPLPTWLIEKGYRADLVGFAALIGALRYVALKPLDPTDFDGLYAALAEDLDTKAIRIERNLRHLFASAGLKGPNRQNIYRLAVQAIAAGVLAS